MGQILSSGSICNSKFGEERLTWLSEARVEVSCCGGSYPRTAWPGRLWFKPLSTATGIARDCKEVSDSSVAKLPTGVRARALGTSFPSTGRSGCLNYPAPNCPPDPDVKVYSTTGARAPGQQMHPETVRQCPVPDTCSSLHPHPSLAELLHLSFGQ